MATTAQRAADKWFAAMSGGQASANYAQGVKDYQGNPMAEAATPEAMERYQTGVLNSITSGKRVRRLNAANPATWKQNALTIGAAALSTGARKAQAKVSAFFQRAMPIFESASQAAAAVPYAGGANYLEKVRAAVETIKAGFANA